MAANITGKTVLPLLPVPTHPQYKEGIVTIPAEKLPVPTPTQFPTTPTPKPTPKPTGRGSSGDGTPLPPWYPPAPDLPFLPPKTPPVTPTTPPVKPTAPTGHGGGDIAPGTPIGSGVGGGKLVYDPSARGGAIEVPNPKLIATNRGEEIALAKLSSDIQFTTVDYYNLKNMQFRAYGTRFGKDISGSGSMTPVEEFNILKDMNRFTTAGGGYFFEATPNFQPATGGAGAYVPPTGTITTTLYQTPYGELTQKQMDFYYKEISPGEYIPRGVVTEAKTGYKEYMIGKTPIKGTLSYIGDITQAGYEKLEREWTPSSQQLFEKLPISGVVQTAPYFLPGGSLLLIGIGAESLVTKAGREELAALGEKISSVTGGFISKEGGTGISYGLAAGTIVLGGFALKSEIANLDIKLPSISFKKSIDTIAKKLEPYSLPKPMPYGYLGKGEMTAAQYEAASQRAQLDKLLDKSLLPPPKLLSPQPISYKKGYKFAGKRIGEYLEQIPPIPYKMPALEMSVPKMSVREGYGFASERIGKFLETYTIPEIPKISITAGYEFAGERIGTMLGKIKYVKTSSQELKEIPFTKWGLIGKQPIKINPRNKDYGFLGEYPDVLSDTNRLNKILKLYEKEPYGYLGKDRLTKFLEPYGKAPYKEWGYLGKEGDFKFMSLIKEKFLQPIGEKITLTGEKIGTFLKPIGQRVKNLRQEVAKKNFAEIEKAKYKYGTGILGETPSIFSRAYYGTKRGVKGYFGAIKKEAAQQRTMDRFIKSGGLENPFIGEVEFISVPKAKPKIKVMRFEEPVLGEGERIVVGKGGQSQIQILERPTSVYAGTMQYETTQIFKPRLGPGLIIGTFATLPKVVTGEVEIPTSNIGLPKGTLQIPGGRAELGDIQIPGERIGLGDIQLPRERTSLRERTEQVTKNEERLREEQQNRLKLKEEQIQQQRYRYDEELKLRDDTQLLPPIGNFIPMPPLPKFKREQKRKKYGKVSPAYSVLIKRRRTFVPIATGLPRGRALQFGSQQVTRELSRQFKIVKAGTTELADIEYKPREKVYREYKVRYGKKIMTPDIYIQKINQNLQNTFEKMAIVRAKKSKAGIQWAY